MKNPFLPSCSTIIPIALLPPPHTKTYRLSCSPLEFGTPALGLHFYSQPSSHFSLCLDLLFSWEFLYPCGSLGYVMVLCLNGSLLLSFIDFNSCLLGLHGCSRTANLLALIENGEHLDRRNSCGPWNVISSA